MKVIQILPELNSGGVERGTLELGKYLAQNGHQSIVISNGGRQTPQLEDEGSRHITLPVHKKRLSSLKQVKALRQLLQHERPDILHLRSRLPAWLAWLAWRKMDPKTRPKLISTVHGFYSVNAYSKIMTSGQSVICVSNSIQDYVLRNYPQVPASKLNVIHRGVDPREYPHDYQPSKQWLQEWTNKYPQFKGKFLVTLPGRITRWKGHLDFIQVIQQLKQTGLPVHGIIAGEAHPRKMDFFEEVKDTLKASQLEDTITLIGHRSDLRDVLAISNVVVSCSTTPEAFGRVTLEALTLGIPVCGYDHGGVAEQLHSMLPAGAVPIGNTAAMSQFIQKCYQQKPQVLPNTTFTLEQMLQKTVKLYQ